MLVCIPSFHAGLSVSAFSALLGFVCLAHSACKRALGFSQLLVEDYPVGPHPQDSWPSQFCYDRVLSSEFWKKSPAADKGEGEEAHHHCQYIRYRSAAMEAEGKTKVVFALAGLVTGALVVITSQKVLRALAKPKNLKINISI